MKAEFGYCLVCEKEIAKVCASCGSRRTTNDYTETQVKWSNGSVMNVAVCHECAKEIGKADKQAMTKAHFDAWDKLGGKYEKEIVIV